MSRAQRLVAAIEARSANATMAEENAPARMPLPRHLTFYNNPGEDWIGFLRSFEYYHVYWRTTDEERRIALRSCMRGPAGAAVESVNIEQLNYKDTIAAYNALFLPPSASALAQTRFEQVVQKKGETVLNYHARVLDLWKRAYPGINDESMLIRRFALGLSKVNVRTHVLRGTPKTFIEALALAQNEVAVDSTNRALMGSAGNEPEPMEIGRIGDDAEEEDDEGVAILRGANRRVIVRKRIPRMGPGGTMGKQTPSGARTGQGFGTAVRGSSSSRGGTGKQKCFECGSSTHLVANCRVRDKKMSGRRTVAAVGDLEEEVSDEDVYYCEEDGTIEEDPEEEESVIGAINPCEGYEHFQ